MNIDQTLSPLPICFSLQCTTKPFPPPPSLLKGVTWFWASSSTYRTTGVNASPLVILGISFTPHQATLITELMCQKVGGYTGWDEWLWRKKKRLKYKMSRCCFNTLPLRIPSPPAWSRSTQSIPPCHSVDRAAALLVLWHPSLLILISASIPRFIMHLSLIIFPVSVCNSSLPKQCILCLLWMLPHRLKH